MIDRRLLGTWISDRRRTALELKTRDRLSAKTRRMLGLVFGKLRIRVTPTRCYSTLDGVTDVLRYRVVASNSQGAVVVGHTLPDWLTADEQIQHIRFVTPDVYWVCTLGGIHEYVRRVKTAKKRVPRR